MFSALGISCDKIPTSAKQIVVPSTFQYAAYVEDITEVIQDCEYNFKYSITDWDTLSRELKKMCTEDISVRIGRKTTLSTAKLFELFSSTPIDQTREEITQFLQEVESKVNLDLCSLMNYAYILEFDLYIILHIFYHLSDTWNS